MTRWAIWVSSAIAAPAIAFHAWAQEPQSVALEASAARTSQALIGNVLTERLVPGKLPFEGTLFCDLFCDNPAFLKKFAPPPPIRRTAIEGSAIDSRGIISINQQASNLTNQANVRVIAFAESDLDIVHLGAAASAVESRGNRLVASAPIERETLIADSFTGTAGIVGVNQTTGNFTQQANVLILAIGVSLEATDLVAVDDSGLGRIRTGARRNAADNRPERSDGITGSFGGFRGIAQISQSSGDGNAVRNTLAISLPSVSGP